MASGCDIVGAFLDSFRSGRKESGDLDRVGAHVTGCPSCYARVSDFFRCFEVKPSQYLAETLDELSFSVYNLVKAILKQSRSAADFEIVTFVEPPGPVEEHVADSFTALDDVEDCTGAEVVGDTDVGEVRRLVRDLRDPSAFERRKTDLAVLLLDLNARLGGKYSLDSLNLKGVIRYCEDRFAEAEAAFHAVIGADRRDLYSRTVNFHAMTNLAYARQQQGDLDAAVRWAGKAVALGEELGLPLSSAEAGLVYFLLLRNLGGDPDRAAERLARASETAERRAEMERLFNLDQNAKMREVLRSSGLAARFPGISLRD